MGPSVRSVIAGVVLATLLAAPALAADRYALVITGAAGGPEYAHKYDGLRTALVNALTNKWRYPADHVAVLAEQPEAGQLAATRENVQRVLSDLRRRVAKDDVLLVVLIGHGTSLDGEDAKFNLVGQDLSASEWAELIKPIAGRIVFVDTTGGSFPFLHRLAAKNRIVVTATDSAAQQFETVFPEYFVKALDDPAADLDKNGRISIWEAFSYASAAVHQHYEQKGTLPTERALLDDTGVGIGRESQTPGPDGALARATFVEGDTAAAGAASDAGLETLVRRRDELIEAVELLKTKKDALAPEEYEAELERMLVELARVSQQIRAKS